MKRITISDRGSIEKISDKILKIQVQSAQLNVAERAKRFVNVH